MTKPAKICPGCQKPVARVRACACDLCGYRLRAYVPQPPRTRSCPGCALVWPIGKVACSCGHVFFTRRSRKGVEITPDEIYLSKLKVVEYVNGNVKELPQVVLKRRSQNTKKVWLIKMYFKKGLTVGEVAAKFKTSKTDIRRYAHDYGIEMNLARSGGVGKEVRKRQAKLLEGTRKGLLDGKSIADIAEALKCHPATVRTHAKKCRDLYGIELPGFDRRQRKKDA